jgi:hypothetical protein
LGTSPICGVSYAKSKSKSGRTMRDDAITAGAVAVIAMCVATAAHEAAGHGGACLLLGGRITLLTSAYFHCDTRSIFVSPAGPLGNLVAGLAGWAALRLLPNSHPRVKLFALLLTAFSFFWAFAYLVSSLATGSGDYAIAFHDFLGDQYSLWRAGGIVAGVVFYVLFSRRLAATAAGLFGARTTYLMRTAWLAATVATVAAASFYAPGRGHAMKEAGLEIGVAAIPLLLPRRQAQSPGDAPAIARSTGWIAVAIIVLAVFAFTLGAGYTA